VIHGEDSVNAARRTFLKRGALTGAVASLTLVSELLGSTEEAASPIAMGVLVDLTKCNGCRRCETACHPSKRRTAGVNNMTRIDETGPKFDVTAFDGIMAIWP